jgi:hypothetical protein
MPMSAGALSVPSPLVPWQSLQGPAAKIVAPLAMSGSADGGAGATGGALDAASGLNG